MTKRNSGPNKGVVGHPNACLTTEQRFEMKVDRSGECHRWTGSKNPSGYGQFHNLNGSRYAHIAALQLAGVEIPPGMQVDHVWARGCRHRDCVRVDHLEVVTSRENTLRGRGVAAINARKTACRRGHEYGPESINPRGHRRCRVCLRDYNQGRRDRSARTS